MAEQWTVEQLQEHLEKQAQGDREWVATTSELMRKWCARGDGVAIYQNIALDSAGLGDCKYVSYGSLAAQLEVDEPPDRLPDIGHDIDWRYWLQGVFRGRV